MELYSYWRSSAAYRLRIALNMKQLNYRVHSVSLSDGEQNHEDYLAINPQGLVPTLMDLGQPMAQSLAILEYLEEAYPQPPLLPEDLLRRSRVRQIANIICCDVHPLCNLRVLNYLSGPLAVSDVARREWYHHWLALGLASIEALLARWDSEHVNVCVGDWPTLADICLIPQLYNARRYELPLDDYPRLLRIEQHCCSLLPFVEAAPEAQPQ